MTILNPIFLQHVIHLNTCKAFYMYTIGTQQVQCMNLMLSGSLPFSMFLGFLRTIICLLLFYWCGYCSLSFQSFAFHRLVTATVRNSKILPLLAQCLKHLT